MFSQKFVCFLSDRVQSGLLAQILTQVHHTTLNMYMYHKNLFSCYQVWACPLYDAARYNHFWRDFHERIHFKLSRFSTYINVGGLLSNRKEPTCPSRWSPYPFTYKYCRSRGSSSVCREEKRGHCPLHYLDIPTGRVPLFCLCYILTITIDRNSIEIAFLIVK